MKMNSTKSKLMASLLVLVLCVTAFFGSTYAWFTDEVVSSNNKIQAGELKVDLEVLENGAWTSIKTSQKALFDYDKWEPGYTDVTILKVVNKGNLALKWNAQLVSESELSVLAELIDVYVKPSETALTMPSGRNLEGYEKVGTVADFVNKLETTTKGELLPEKEAYLGIALKMPETVENEYKGVKVQGLSLGGTFDIRINATQKDTEPDSFGSDYDKPAGNTGASGVINAVSVAEPVTVDADNKVTETVTVGEVDVNGAEVTVPAGAKTESNTTTKFDLSITPNVTTPPTITVEDGTTAKTYEIKVVGLAADNTEPVEVKLNIGLGKDKDTLKLYHEETQIPFESYDPVTGVLTFKTATFSPFTVVYGDATISNEAELKAALEGNGGTYKVIQDITVDADNTIKVPAKANILLDMNGYSIDGVADGTGNREMFLVKGNLTVINGKMSIKTTVNQGWNAMSTVFDVTDGGVLNLKNVTVDNLGGTDMNFCVHLNNWGEVTLNVDNSTLKATYIAVRAFNSGNDMNNIVIKNTTLEGKYCYWVHNYTLADFGNDASKQAAHAKLVETVDIFNGTNTFKSTSTIAPVLYGFTDAIYFDANGTKLVVDAKTFTEAIAVDKTVTLGADITLEDIKLTVPAGKNVTLNLNGYSIGGISTKSGTSALIENKGTLTLEGNGTISVLAEHPDTDWDPEGFPTYASNTIANRGTLTVKEGVTIVNETAQGGASYAIDNYAGATLTVDGGTIKQTGGDIAIRMNTASATANNVTINEGSTISGRRAIWIHLAGSNAAVAPEVNLTINGGELTGTQMAIYSYSYGNSFAKTNVAIDGGTFDGDVQFGGGYKGDKETVTITGGTFNGKLGRWLENDGWEDITK